MTRQLLASALLLAGAGTAAAQRAPAPTPSNLPPEVISLACAPALVFEAPPVPIRVTGGQDSDIRRIFAPGDLITINAGTDNGIDVGQEYYTRRAVPRDRSPIGRDNPAMIHTSGWVRIWAVDKTMSLATIVHACDAIDLEDYLEPFVAPEPAPAASATAPAQRGNYGRVIAGHDNRTVFGRGDYFIVDRGSDHGVTIGAAFVVYRDHQRRERMLLERIGRRQGDDPLNFLFELGEAVAVDVGPDRSTLRITLARDGFIVGDWVALRK